jgi:hypothetical protein
VRGAGSPSCCGQRILIRLINSILVHLCQVRVVVPGCGPCCAEHSPPTWGGAIDAGSAILPINRAESAVRTSRRSLPNARHQTQLAPRPGLRSPEPYGARVCGARDRPEQAHTGGRGVGSARSRTT